MGLDFSLFCFLDIIYFNLWRIRYWWPKNANLEFSFETFH